MSDQLFAFDGKVEGLVRPLTHGHGTTAKGSIAEMRLVAELLSRGHRVAVPVCDDDGVDLIVDYKTIVQVKSCAARDWDGSVKINARKLAPHIDIVAVYAHDTGAWWHIPRDQLRNGQRRITLLETRRVGLSVWRDAWDTYRGASA